MTRAEILQALEAQQLIQQRNPPASEKWREASENIRHLVQLLKPFDLGAPVYWESAAGTCYGIVYAVQWLNRDGGYWRVAASANGQPWHPETNNVPYLVASARKFQGVQ